MDLEKKTQESQGVVTSPANRKQNIQTWDSVVNMALDISSRSMSLVLSSFVLIYSASTT